MDKEKPAAAAKTGPRCGSPDYQFRSRKKVPADPLPRGGGGDGTMSERTEGFIDTHHHAMLPEYVTALGKIGVAVAGGVPFPRWDARSDLALMDRHGIAAAVLSVSAPGVFFDDIWLARRLARQCNE